MVAGMVPKAAELPGQHRPMGKLAGTTGAATRGVGEKCAHPCHLQEICYCNSNSIHQGCSFRNCIHSGGARRQHHQPMGRVPRTDPWGGARVLALTHAGFYFPKLKGKGGRNSL